MRRGPTAATVAMVRFALSFIGSVGAVAACAVRAYSQTLVLVYGEKHSGPSSAATALVDDASSAAAIRKKVNPAALIGWRDGIDQAQ